MNIQEEKTFHIIIFSFSEILISILKKNEKQKGKERK